MRPLHIASTLYYMSHLMSRASDEQKLLQARILLAQHDKKKKPAAKGKENCPTKVQAKDRAEKMTKKKPAIQ